MQTKNEAELSSENCLELGAVLKEIKQDYFSSLLAIACLVGLPSMLNLLCGGNFIDYLVYGADDQFYYFNGHRISAPGILISVLGLAFAYVCVNYSLREQSYRCLRFHENGISFLQSGKETKIPYSKLEQLDFKKTEQYLAQDKQHYSSNFDLEFMSNSTGSIKWSTTTVSAHSTYVSRDSTDYDWLNHHLSQIVAGNIVEQIEMGHKIPWGESAFIGKAGLEIKKKTGLLSSELIAVPWSDLTNIQFRDGQLSLEIGKPQSSQSWTSTIHCDEANVLPGYLAVKRLLKSQTASAAIRYQSEDEISSAMASEYITPYYGV